MNLDPVISPENYRHKNSVNVKNNLGMPNKSQGNDTNNNIGATTIATTAATNGTALSEPDEVNRNL